MTRLGAIAALAAGILSALAFGSPVASANEASVDAAADGRVISSMTGVASYYGKGFYGRRTASGEVFVPKGISAAHKTLPIPSYARVTNLSNGRSVIVRVNDRGPFVAGRMLDVSERVANLLLFRGGMERVRLDYLGKAGPAGAEDNSALLDTLKTGAAPAAVAKAKPPAATPVKVAERASALGYAEPARRPTVASAPAATALSAAVRPPFAPTTGNLASGLDAAARRIEAALEAVSRVASDAGGSPYGGLVIAPFRAQETN